MKAGTEYTKQRAEWFGVERLRSLKRWRYGTPAWKRRCDAAIRRDARKNEGSTGYAWMPHYVKPPEPKP